MTYDEAVREAVGAWAALMIDDVGAEDRFARAMFRAMQIKGGVVGDKVYRGVASEVYGDVLQAAKKMMKEGIPGVRPGLVASMADKVPGSAEAADVRKVLRARAQRSFLCVREAYGSQNGCPVK
jgi:hypothetical protein